MVPLLFLLALPWLDRRKVLLAWPLTHAPDLDYVIGYHRATLHNAWILLPFLVGLWWWSRPATRDAGRREWMVIALVYLASHLAMDVFAGGVTMFYPLSLWTPCYYGRVIVETATDTPVVELEACTYEGIPVVAEFYTWLPPQDAAMLAFVVPAGLAVAAARWWWDRRQRAPREHRQPPAP